MKDERIQATSNRFAGGGFWILLVLLWISLVYRMWILKQHPREWWDIFAILIIGTFFVFVAYANKGVLDHDFKRRWLAIGIVLIIVIPAVQFFMGHIQSVGDLAGTLIGLPLGLGPVIGISYFLNRRWKRKEGIED